MTELLATFFFNYYFVVHLFVAFRCVVCFRNLTKKRNAFSSLFTITDYFTLRHNNKGFRMHFWVNIMFMLVYYYYNYYFVLNAFWASCVLYLVCLYCFTALARSHTIRTKSDMNRKKWTQKEKCECASTCARINNRKIEKEEEDEPHRERGEQKIIISSRINV